MAVEKLIEDLIAALDRNTAALQGAAVSAEKAPADKPARTKGKEATETKTVTQDEMNAALLKIKDKFGLPEAKAVIKAHGGCEKMSEIKPAKFQAVFDAAVAHYDKLEADAAGETTDNSDEI